MAMLSDIWLKAIQLTKSDPKLFALLGENWLAASQDQLSQQKSVGLIVNKSDQIK